MLRPAYFLQGQGYRFKGSSQTYVLLLKGGLGSITLTSSDLIDY